MVNVGRTRDPDPTDPSSMSLKEYKKILQDNPLSSILYPLWLIVTEKLCRFESVPVLTKFE